MARTGLRFDKTALRLVSTVRSALSDAVPEGKTVVFTVTAPIRLPARTATSIVDVIRRALTRKGKVVEVKKTIHGNGICVWIVAGTRKAARKVAGYVHNPDVDARGLLDQALHSGSNPSRRT